MKKLTTTLFSQLGNVCIQTLTTIVKETLAVDGKPFTPKTFTAADLWNIQRQKKGLVQRRHRL